jgi:hypothetical protein
MPELHVKTRFSYRDRVRADDGNTGLIDRIIIHYEQTDENEPEPVITYDVFVDRIFRFYREERLSKV